MTMISAAALLDELMGSDRNLAPDQKGKSTHWSDHQVCKYHLCGFCPSELFINTRSDLGPCEKLHDDKLKTGYEESNRYGQMGYEEDFLRYLQTIMTDVERRIRRGHARLIPREKEPLVGKVDNEKEEMLSNKINSLVEQVEELGSEGKIEEAQGVMKLIDQLKDEKEQLNGRGRDHMTSQEKQMEVCEVCGAFLIVGDAQTRVDDHLQGKQHMGYARIKSTLEEMRSRPWKKLMKNDTEKEPEPEVTLKERDKDTSNDRDRVERRRDRDRDRDRNRDQDRDRNRDRRRDRDRDYNRDRRRDRDQNRDRDRDRERNRDRDRDSKEDSKRYDKDKSRRSRSRSRERSVKDKDDEKRRSGSPRKSESPK